MRSLPARRRYSAMLSSASIVITLFPRTTIIPSSAFVFSSTAASSTMLANASSAAAFRRREASEIQVSRVESWFHLCALSLFRSFALPQQHPDTRIQSRIQQRRTATKNAADIPSGIHLDGQPLVHQSLEFGREDLHHGLYVCGTTSICGTYNRCEYEKVKKRRKRRLRAQVVGASGGGSGQQQTKTTTNFKST